MKSSGDPEFGELADWQYDGPPGHFDLIENTPVTRALRVLLHVLLRAYLHGFHRYRAVHAEPLSALPPCLIVANHTSHLDTPSLFSAFPLRRINRARSLAAKDYFFSNPFVRFTAFLVANIIPLDRAHPDPDCLRYCRRVAEEGGSLIVFPEGTRSDDGLLHAFRPGIGLLVKRLQLPVLPAYIHGAYACMNRRQTLPRPGRISVRTGEVLDYAGTPDSREGWQEIAADLERRVRELGGSG